MFLRGDIEAGNGLVQIIDSVLRPPEDIASIAARVPRLSTFLAALEAASLVETFTCTNGECPAKPVTVFAPTNAAFKTLQEDVTARDGGSIVISTRSVPKISGDV